MNTIKRFNLSIALIISSLFFLTANLSAQHQQGKGPRQIPNESRINKMVDNLSAELSLNDGQKTEILALYIDHFDEAKSLMNNEQRPSREEMESLRAEFEDDVKSLLTEEQQEEFDDFLKNNDSQRKNHRNKKDRK